MTRQDESLQLAEDLLKDVELAETSTSRRVLKAMRLARLARNSEAQVWLGYEINGVTGNDSGRRWMSITKRWTDEANEKGYWSSSAHIESTRDATQTALVGHSAQASLSGDYVALAMNSRAQQINNASKVIASLGQVLSAVDAQIYQFAAKTYAELKFSELQATLFEQSRAAVDSRLSGMTGDALKAIDSVAERLGTDDPTAVSQAMTTCRQLIDAVADHVFPARDEPYDVGGGRLLEVKADKVKNRLNAYVHERGVSGGRAARIGNNLNHVYDRVSASVHKTDVVSGHEARYLFLSTYMVLGEVLTLDHAELREMAGTDHA